MKEARKPRALARRTASLSIAVLVLACSSKNDSSSGTSQYQSRVDESKALGTLTPDEQVTLCQDVASWMNSFTMDPTYITGSCTLTAISTASLDASTNGFTVDQMRQDCTMAETQCMSSESTAPLPSSRGCAYPTTCTATVGDLKNCTVGTYQGNMKLFATLPSCDAVQLNSGSMIDYSLETGALSVCNKVTACGPPT